MGMVNGQPDATNIYRSIEWDIDRIFLALMIVIQPLVGIFYYNQKFNYQTRLAWLLCGGVNYLILAVPSLTHKALLSCLVTSLLLAYNWHKFRGHKDKVEEL